MYPSPIFAFRFIDFTSRLLAPGRMLPEGDNAVFGRSDNRWDLGRTPGGSSGGDASLVASRYAPLELGSDVGESIRIPCHFAGTSGVKPTPERMDEKGMDGLSKVEKATWYLAKVRAGRAGMLWPSFGFKSAHVSCWVIESPKQAKKGRPLLQVRAC